MTESASYLEESFHVQGHYPSFGTVSPIASGSRHSDEISIGADEKHKQSGVVNSKLKSGFVHHPILMIGQSAPTFAEPVKGTSPAVIDELGLYRVDVFLRLSDAPKGIVSEMLADFIDDMPRPEHGVPGQAHTARISAQQSKLPATIFEIGGFSVHKLSEGKGNASQFRAGYIDIAVEDDRDPSSPIPDAVYRRPLKDSSPETYSLREGVVSSALSRESLSRRANSPAWDMVLSSAFPSVFSIIGFIVTPPALCFIMCMSTSIVCVHISACGRITRTLTERKPMMFGLFGKKKERRHPVILDLSVKEKPDGWDELTRLGFEPVFVNHKPRPNGISGDYVQTRWRLKANPDVTCTVYDSWEGGGGATFLDFDAPWNPQRIHGGCNLSWPNYTLDRLHSLGKVLFEGDRSEFEEPDSGNLDLRGITPDPVREKMRELGLRMERDDSHDSNGDDSDEEYWCKYDQGELRDLHRSRLALYAHVDRTAGTVAIVDVETGKQATLGFDKLLKLNRVEYGKRRACS